MLKGRSITTLDKWGRVRIPAMFRRIIERKYGRYFFVTSIGQKNVLVYPLSEWDKIMTILSERAREREVRQFAIVAARWGKKVKMDKQGRILIEKELRLKTKLEDKIVIEGVENHLILKQAS